MYSPKDICQKIRQAGVVGAGGAGFPTYIKFSAKADIFLVNAAECEPLLKVDQQLITAYAGLLVRGLALGMQATGALEGIIAIKAKYQRAIEALEPLLEPSVRLHILEDVYPAGDEVITIWMATGRRVPPAKLPLDVGVIVNNPQTLINVAQAVDKEQPVICRTLTVTGAVRKPLTITAPIGVAMKELVAEAGGPAIADAAYIEGGPMMGKLIEDLEEPITKMTGGIIALPKTHILIRRHQRSLEAHLRIAKMVCEQCCLCTELCPRHIIGHELPPHLIVRAINYNDIASTSVLLSALTCSECAICEAWSCPVDISPMRLNRALKTKFRAQKMQYQGTLRTADPMAKSRLIPTARLIKRLNIATYNHDAPLSQTLHPTKVVRLKLNQHIGTAASPLIKVGDKVQRGQIVADVPKGTLGVPIHASIDGVVDTVNDHIIGIRSL